MERSSIMLNSKFRISIFLGLFVVGGVGLTWVTPPHASAQGNGLVAAYSFNEGTGTTVADLSGNGNNGTIVGATWTTAGKYGNALSFNGTSSYVDIGNGASLQMTGSMTWSAWIIAAANPSDDGIIVAKSDTTSGWQLKTTPDTGPQTFGAAVTNSAGSRIQRYSSAVRSLNTWYHVAGVYDASAKTLDVYVNGVLNDGKLTGTIPASQLNSTANANIGRRTGGLYFNGVIDEVRIYNRALSAAEIQADMDTPLGGTGTDTQAPTAPASLSATTVSASQINLSWSASTDNVGVAGYRIERCQGTGCVNFAQIAAPSGTGTTYSDTGLTAATSYVYRVRAADAAGNLGGYSPTALATTQSAADTQAPTAPATLSATPASASQINLSWSASTDNVGVTGYRIERCEGTGCINFAQIAAPSGAGTTYSDTGLTAAASYVYRVRAADAAGNLGGYSPTALATTQSAADTQAPTAPASLSATTVSTSQINLGWSASTDNVGVTGYRIERCQGAGCVNFAQISSVAGNGIAGPLKDSPSNPRYFLDSSGRPLVLTGSHTWNNLQDWGTNGSSQPLDFNAYVNFLSAHGHNFTLLWRLELPHFCNLPTTASAPPDFTVTSHPWQRTGPGTATDGGLKFDLSKFDQSFFDRVRTRVQQLNGANIYAGIYLFTGEWLAVYRCSNDGYPLTGANNINGIDDGGGAGSVTMSAPNSITSIQDAFVEKLVDTLNDLPNVVWIVSEEAPSNSTWWNGHQISHVRTYESGKAQQHPVGWAVMSDFNDATIYNSNADWVAPAARISPASACGNGSPACKVNINDSDHSYYGMWNDSAQTNRQYAWENFLTGNQVVFMDPYTVYYPRENRNLCGSPSNGICSAPDARWNNFRDNLGYIGAYSRKLNLVNVNPMPSLSSTSYCLAQTPASGAEYLVYAPNGGAFTVNLSATTRVLNVEWLNPSTGAITTAGTVNGGSTSQSFTPPFSGDAVLYLVDSGGHAGGVSGGPTTYNDTALTPNTTYTYRVRAVDAAGNLSGYSNTAAATTTGADTQPPSSPGSLSATAAGASQINLTWTASSDNVGVTGYTVERCQSAGCSNFAPVGSAGGAATSYSDSSLASSTSYSYRVRASDAAGNLSAYSNTAGATTSTAASGLIAAYSFNEGSGSTVADLTGNGNNGTVVGATWTTGGKYGNALSFNGSSSYVDLGNSAMLQITGSMTWSAWINAAANPSDDGMIVAKSDNSSGWQLKTTPDTGPHTFGAAITASSGARIQRYTPTARSLNTWYHVAGVYNASAMTLDVYVNGVLSDGSLTGTVPASQVNSSVNVNIGRRTGGYYFNGVIDEVRIYNRALSQSEIQADMNTPLGSGGSNPPAAVTLSSPNLDFGSQTVGVSSAPKSVTLTNTGGAQLAIGSIAISGANSSDFTQSNNCGTSLATNASCAINVVFKPSAAGARSAAVTISDNASGSPHTVALSGSGTSTAYLSVSPRVTALTRTRTQQFSAANNSGTITWLVDGVSGGSSASGTITSAGFYTPPTDAGTHTVTALDQTESANATVYVTNYPGTFTRDVDNLRTGLNSNETVLSPANVNSAQFGKLWSYGIDGVSDASPLYVANVSIPGQGFHNMVYVATEHDSVYAFDADGASTNPLWKISFINAAAGVTTVPPGDTGECCDIAPEIGITGSPVIDPATGTLYVIAKTKEVSGSNTNYVHRLHALDIATGAEKFGGPVIIQASVLGNGAGASGGLVSFLSLRENQRAALLLSNGVVYAAFAAHGDQPPYHGWVLGYNAATLQQVMAYNSTPNGNGGGIWQSGDGLATDSTGNIYFVTGNGDFNGNTGGGNYGDSFVKITTSGVVSDYFTPHDQANMAAQDLDLGSGGTLLLPDQSGPHPHLAISAGKNGTIYLVDRDNMGHYNPNNDSQIVQSLTNVFPNGNYITGNFKAPLYFNGSVYFSADADNVKSYKMSNGLISTSPTSQTALIPGYPGATLSMSSNGATNGILWVLQRIDNDPTGGGGPRAPGVLHAYDATNLGVELYNSNQAPGSRDALDFVAKWSATLVANGKVFVATNARLTVYSLLP